MHIEQKGICAHIYDKLIGRKQVASKKIISTYAFYSYIDL